MRNSGEIEFAGINEKKKKKKKNISPQFSKTTVK